MISIVDTLDVKKRNKKYICGFLALIVFVAPLLIFPKIFNGIGIFDWDTALQRYAAIYLTYVEFHQYPGNNIWIGGGTPLSQIYPGYGIYAAATLIAGPSLGIYFGVFFYYVMGFVGAIKLAKLYSSRISIQVFFALYTVFGNALAWHLSVGHLIFANILLLPYILYFILSIKNKYSGAKAGALCGICFLDGFAYTSQYILLIVGAAILFLFLKNQEKKSDVVLFSSQFILVFLSIVFYRIYSIFPIFQDFPRVVVGGTNYEIFEFIKFSIRPYFQLQGNVTNSYCNGVWENANYIGLTTLIVLVYAAIKRSVFFLIPIVFLYAAFSNDVAIFDFNYYLKLLPTFSSHWCTARIRLLSPYIFGIALLIFFAKRDSDHIKIFKTSISNKTLMVLVLIEVYVASTAAFIHSHKYERASTFHWSSNFQNYFDLPKNVETTFEATMSNIGVLNASDSNLPKSRIAIGREDELYISEFTQNKKLIEPTYWSPNLIIFQTDDLNNCIQTRIPAGNLWSINGMDLYRSDRSVEFEKLICAYPDENGRVEIQWQVRDSKIGIQGNSIFIVLSISLLLFSHFKYYKKRRQPPFRS